MVVLIILILILLCLLGYLAYYKSVNDKMPWSNTSTIWARDIEVSDVMANKIEPKLYNYPSYNTKVEMVNEV